MTKIEVTGVAGGGAFDVASGSVMGLDHVYAGRPNQDALCIRRVGDSLIVVVADGCSDGPHNEVGAHFGSAAMAEILASRLDMMHLRWAFRPGDWELARFNLRCKVEHALEAMGGDWHDDAKRRRRQLINDYWLFTLLVGVITPERAEFAAIGDGYLEVNGNHFDLGSFENNSPPYLAYALTQTSLPPEALEFRVLASLPTSELQSFIVGTDGARDLCLSSLTLVPGQAEAIGPMKQFFADRYFTNPDNVRRRLAVVNGGAGVPGHKGGQLRDDTTLIVGRRKPQADR